MGVTIKRHKPFYIPFGPCADCGELYGLRTRGGSFGTPVKIIGNMKGHAFVEQAGKPSYFYRTYTPAPFCPAVHTERLEVEKQRQGKSLEC
jgi:hypothetical protein